MSKEPVIVIEVANFMTSQPHFMARVNIEPSGKARIVYRSGWTHDKAVDRLAISAAKRLARDQRHAA